MNTPTHTPVMLEEVLKYLSVQPKQWYIDATFGRGGHTRGILDQGGQVLALDWDNEAVMAGNTLFAPEISSGQLSIVRRGFDQITQVWQEHAQKTKAEQPAGILFDFGTSVEQLTSGKRGFSFADDGPLDMRMDDRLGVTAADLLAAVPQKQLAQLFAEYGGESYAAAIAKAIKTAPQAPQTTTELTQLIHAVKGERQGKLDSATQVYQALRIAVNSELDQIELALPQAFALLAAGGHLLTVAFHEGEDRIAKQFAVTLKQSLPEAVITKKPLTPSEAELTRNPRSRSAKLRVFCKPL